MQDSYKVLIVDDDLRLRSLLERYLTEQGFQIRTAANPIKWIVYLLANLSILLSST